MRCAIYARVSTEEQATEGYSISAQKKRLASFCEAQDWEIIGYYIDEGLSAKHKTSRATTHDRTYRKRHNRLCFSL